MSSLFHVLVIPFLILGLLVNTLGVVSLFRFKDVYMRMHGATKCSTLGTLFCALGVIVYALIRLVSGGEARFAVLVIHVIAAVFGLLIANSTGAHVLARAAYRSGIRPKYAVVDDLDAFCAKELQEEDAAAAKEEE
ncbi:MAG: monovalent cation/H(+) antiporter subunit G [Pyramidobacter sp.]|nr:monovalent cation/H(+) antiporter subunit G [Pyramidobacter sp.]